MTRTGLPDVKDCVEYIKSLGYCLINRGRGFYTFEDSTGKRPAHNKVMTWNLNEMRHAFKHGC